MWPRVHWSFHHHHHPAPRFAATTATAAHCVTPGKYLVLPFPRMLTRAQARRFGRERRIRRQRQRIRRQRPGQRAGQRAGEGKGCPQVSCNPDLPPTPPSPSIRSPTTCHVTDVPRHRRAHRHPPLPRRLPRQRRPPPSSCTSTTSAATSASPPPPPSRLPRRHHRSPPKNPPAPF